MIRVLPLALVIAGAATATACGRQGDLVRPEPQADARPAPRAGQGQRPGEDRRRQEQPPAAPTSGSGATVPTIPSAPIEGTTGDPAGRPPPVTPNE
jgi:predicted small lipoprotein YifL